MYITHIWNKFSIYGTKIIITCFFLLLSIGFMSKSHAQQKGKTSTIYNLSNFDKKKLHYGFQIGLVSTPTGVKMNEKAINYDNSGQPQDLLTVNPENTMSFLLGFLLNVNLSKDNHWALRFSPNVTFYARNFTSEITFKDDGSEIDVRDLDQLQSNTTLDFPILLKYQSDRRKNHRLYLLGGFTPSYTVAIKQDSPTEEFYINMKKFNMSFTWGFGMHIYNKMFCLSPEIRISHGLLNVADNSQESIFMPYVDAIRQHKISFIINFEG
ncbi:type IX secretion/gliding motility protein PorT/SprT [Flammeovirga kamogawensis]|nr:PorT family protein [Flammeovirga kamogawensis]